MMISTAEFERVKQTAKIHLKRLELEQIRREEELISKLSVLLLKGFGVALGIVWFIKVI